MKLIVPKASRGYFFDRLFSVEFNDVDVERLLPSLFYLVVTRGRQRGANPNDATDLAKYVGALSAHPGVRGFASAEGRRLLESWVRSAIVRTGRVGRGRTHEQMEVILPLSLLSYKTGFPAEIRRQRNVHTWLYRICLDVLRETAGESAPEARLSDIFCRAFGRGVRLGPAPDYSGRYDGETELDVHTLLSLYFLDGFESVPASRKESTVRYQPALPALARAIGEDFLRYVLAWRNRLPALALTRGVMALINFQLFIYGIALAYATNQLSRESMLPPAMTPTSGTPGMQLYVDFTRQRGAPSDEIARTCVARDLEEMTALFDSVIEVRTVSRFASQIAALNQRLEGLDTPSYLLSLVKLRGEPSIEARAQAECESIEYETIQACTSDAERAEAEAFFAKLRTDPDASALQRAVRLLTDAQRDEALSSSYSKWFWSSGGLRKPFGLLAGNLKGRRNWRYAMSDDLLATLVQLSMIEDPSGRLTQAVPRPRIRLSEFLQFLHDRFAVIVDRPPAFLDSTVTRAAARENLEALRRRLRQMGVFEALSDDFTAEYLRNPNIEEVSA